MPTPQEAAAELRRREAVAELQRREHPAPSVAAPTSEPSILDRIKADMQSRNDQAMLARSEYLAGNQSYPEQILQQAGVGAGMVGDIPAELIKSTLSMAGKIPGAKYAASKVGEAVMSLPGLSTLPDEVSGLAKGYENFSAAHPRAARNINAVTNLAMVVPTGVKYGEDVISSVDDAARGVGRNIKNAVLRPEKLSSEEIRYLGGESFKKADALGGVIHPYEAGKFVDDVIKDITPQTGWGAAPGNKDKVDAVLKRLDAVRNSGEPLTLHAAMELDSNLGDLAHSSIDAFGKYNPDGESILRVQRALRNTIEEAANNGHVLGGTEGVAAWKEGKKYWAAQAKLRDVERILENSKSAAVPATSIRTGFKTLLNNGGKMAGYSDEEIKAIKQAARTGVVTDVLATVGSRLTPLAAASVGAAAGGGLPGAIAGATVGYVGSAASRKSAALMQGGKANKVADLIRSRVGGAPPSSVVSDTLKTMATGLKIGTPQAAGQLTLEQILQMPASQALPLIQQMQQQGAQ